MGYELLTYWYQHQVFDLTYPGFTDKGLDSHYRHHILSHSRQEIASFFTHDCFGSQVIPADVIKRLSITLLRHEHYPFHRDLSEREKCSMEYCANLAWDEYLCALRPFKGPHLTIVLFHYDMLNSAAQMAKCICFSESLSPKDYRIIIFRTILTEILPKLKPMLKLGRVIALKCCDQDHGLTINSVDDDIEVLVKKYSKVRIL